MEKKNDSTADLKEDMNKIFSKVCGNEDVILIPKFNDYVQQITPDEEQIYEKITDFDVDEIK